MRDLAVLLAAPGREVAAAELLGRPPTGADRVLDDRARADDVLVAELSAATGLGGRGRRLADDAERSRKTVTARIRYAVKRIGAAHPELGAHLDAAVRTGSQCSYQPAEALTWRT
jgi:hypothetical protein